MKKVILTVTTALVLLSTSTGAALKTHQAYENNAYSEILLEDVKAESYAWIPTVLDIIAAGITIIYYSHEIQKDYADEKIPAGTLPPKTMDYQEIPCGTGYDDDGIERQRHQIICPPGIKYANCTYTDPHLVGYVCNYHKPS